MRYLILALFIAGSLCACAEDSFEEGLHAEVGATNQKSKTATGDAEEGTTKQFVRDIDGRQFQLQTGLVNVVPVELVPCGVLARLHPLDWVLPAAYAHGADEHAPGGLLDVSQPDGEDVELGEVPAAPGQYCGLRVQLLPAAGLEVHEGELDANGKSLYVNSCYYYRSGAGGESPAATHYCFTLALTEASEERVLEFAEPVTLDAAHRDVDLHIRVSYDRWFERESASDAFSALDGYDAVASNPPCGTPVADATACTAAKSEFKAGLQGNTALKALVMQNALGSLEVELADDGGL